MKSLLIFATIALLGIGAFIYGTSHLPEEVSPTPKYDSYVFAVQWGKTVCLYTSGCESKVGVIPTNQMSIHGLWPSLKSGKILEPCNKGAEIAIKDSGSDIFMKMAKYWPSLMGPNEKFWTHEYNKHGYCYSDVIQDFNPEKYFEKSLDLLMVKKINTLMTDTFGFKTGELSIPYNEFFSKLEKQFGGNYFFIQCKILNKKQYFLEMRITMGLDFNYINIKGGHSCNKNLPVNIIFQ